MASQAHRKHTSNSQYQVNGEQQELDLSQLEVTELRLNIDVANCKVIMLTPTGTTNAYISAGVSNVEVVIPDGTATKIQVNTDLSALEMNNWRFRK